MDASLPGTGSLAGAGPDAAALAAAPLGEPLTSAGQLRLSARGPLVGRAAEFAVLDAASKRALGGDGSVVVLRGDPGLGKTRLVRECRDRFMAGVGARGRTHLPLWLEGRAASYNSATPYGLYQQLLAGWIGVAPDQPRPAVRAALEAALARLLASTELLPLLEHVMGMPPVAGRAEAGQARPLQNEELREAAFGALRTVISRLVPATRPAVIVLEDLHWADPTSLRFTRELISLAAGRPLLILATTRPDAGPDVDELRRSPHVRTVELRLLPDSATRDLARALLGPDVTEEVVSAARRPASTGTRCSWRSGWPRWWRPGPWPATLAAGGYATARAMRSRRCSTALSGPALTAWAPSPRTSSGWPRSSARSSRPRCSTTYAGGNCPPSTCGQLSTS